MSALSSRLVSLETEARRRSRERLAQAIACTEGVTVEEACTWVAAGAEDAALVREQYRGDSRDVEKITRWVAVRYDLSEAEIAATVELAERVVNLLEREEA